MEMEREEVRAISAAPRVTMEERAGSEARHMDVTLDYSSQTLLRFNFLFAICAQRCRLIGNLVQGSESTV